MEDSEEDMVETVSDYELEKIKNKANVFRRRNSLQIVKKAMNVNIIRNKNKRVSFGVNKGDNQFFSKK